MRTRGEGSHTQDRASSPETDPARAPTLGFQSLEIGTRCRRPWAAVLCSGRQPPQPDTPCDAGQVTFFLKLPSSLERRQSPVLRNSKCWRLLTLMG